MEHPALIGPRAVEILDNLADGRLLEEIYGYEPGWGYPSAQDRDRIIAIMAATNEAETRTEGPPETAEAGRPGTKAAGDVRSMDI
ncbi:glutamate synthase (ferredoxin) [Nocardioides terrae]|uniref:Glutamate synthase (Ferredoxin) n=1 Tax=Nocardioides terrae TaxID=574651 RepID=A0A1I1DMV9_9ACTN|nr:hypothetical protein [Nocardioides terrae]SFB76167.1 glutamate synthase (ferredoxin) [Nocardioides terrae]